MLDYAPLNHHPCNHVRAGGCLNRSCRLRGSYGLDCYHRLGLWFERHVEELREDCPTLMAGVALFTQLPRRVLCGNSPMRVWFFYLRDRVASRRYFMGRSSQIIHQIKPTKRATSLSMPGSRRFPSGLGRVIWRKLSRDLFKDHHAAVESHLSVLVECRHGGDRQVL
jgi:hypothetical protein